MRVQLRHLIEQLLVGRRGFLQPIEVLIKGSLLQCSHVATLKEWRPDDGHYKTVESRL
jgi:hypothetical protein